MKSPEMQDLMSRVLAQREQDNIDLVFPNGRKYQVTQEELTLARKFIGGDRLLGYDLYVSEPEVTLELVTGTFEYHVGARTVELN